MRFLILTGLIAFTFGCTAGNEDTQSASDPITPLRGHGEKSPPSNDSHAPHGDSGSHEEMKMNLVSRRALKIQTEPQEPNVGSPTRLTLQIQGDDDTPIKQFDVMHEKLVHLIVVRDGLDEFAHLHPEVDATGDLTVEYVFPKSGTYRLFADHRPKGESPGLAIGELIISGTDAPAAALVADTAEVVTMGEIKAHIDVLKGDHETTVRFRLVDKEENAVTDLEPYLGAMGHLVIISSEGRDYVHAHPLSEARTAPNGVVEFAAHFPKAGLYKAWGQFQRGGSVFTIPFVIEHKGGNSN